MLVVLTAGLAAFLQSPSPDDAAPPHDLGPDLGFPETFVLSWRAPDPCPDHAWIEQRVRALLTGPPRGRDEAVLAGEVRRTPDGFALTLQSRYRESSRTFELAAPHCKELAESVALIIAISLEPGLQERRSQVPPAPEPAEPHVHPSGAIPAAPGPPAPEPKSASGPELPPAAAPAGPGPGEARLQPARPTREGARRRRSFARLGAPGILLDVGLGTEWGLFSAPMLATSLRLGVHWRWLAVEARALYAAPRRWGEGPEGRVHGGLAGVAACFVPPLRPVTFPLCLGLDAGAVEAWTRGRTPPGRARGPWMGPRVAAAMVWMPQRVPVGLRLDLDLGIRMIWTDFSVDGAELTRSFPLSVRASAGIVVALSRSRPGPDKE